MALDIVTGADDDTSLDANDRLWGDTGGGSPTAKRFTRAAVSNYVIGVADTLYPTIAQLSSLDDYVSSFTLQKDQDSGHGQWEGQSLRATGFADGTASADLATYGQLQQAVLDSVFDISALTTIASPDSAVDLLLIYDTSAGLNKKITPDALIAALNPDLGVFVATPSSANLKALVTDETGSGALVFADTPTLVTPVLGAATATSVSVGDDSYAAGWNGSTLVPTKNAVYDKIELILGTTLPAAYQPLDSDLTAWAGVTRASGYDTFAATPSIANLMSLLTDDASGLGTFLTTPSSANLKSLITDETGSGGALVFATGPTIASPIITTSPTAAGATWTDLGAVTTADINGGTVDGAVIGGASAAAGTFTTLAATTSNLQGGTATFGTVAGTIDMGGATSLEIPNSAAPTVNADGEIALDTTVTDFSHGIILYYGGEEMAIIAVPVAQLGSPNNNYAVMYDSTADEFQLKDPSIAGANATLSNLGTVAVNTSLLSDTDNTDDLGSASVKWRYLYTGQVRFDDADGINDDSGNEHIRFQKTASAVNQFDITNAATGTGPTLEATGDDSNIHANIASKGTGLVNANGVNVLGCVPGYIYGLSISNNAGDASNDIDIAAGAAADAAATSSDAAPALMILSSSITKRLDAAWAVGTGNGGLDTGAEANSTFYSVYLIRRPDTGVVDALFTATFGSPTMPANYTQKRYLGRVFNNGSSVILPFTQLGNQFLLTTVLLDWTTDTLTTSRSTNTMTVPPSCSGIFSVYTYNTTAGHHLWIGRVAEPDAAPSSTAAPGVSLRGEVTDSGAAGEFEINVDASSQIAARSNASSTKLRVFTRGWYDPNV